MRTEEKRHRYSLDDTLRETCSLSIRLNQTLGQNHAHHHRLFDAPLGRAGDCVSYSVRATSGGKEGEPSPEAQAVTCPGKAACLTIPLDDKTATVQKVGNGDLDGDGRYDFVVKTPKDNIEGELVDAAAMGYYQVPMTSYDLATGKR